MSETKNLTADDAIERAFEIFDKYVRGAKKSHILLEGLELNDSACEWRVVIGFDLGRMKEAPDPRGPIFQTFSQNVKEPIREHSVIIIDAASGDLKRIDAID